MGVPASFLVASAIRTLVESTEIDGSRDASARQPTKERGGRRVPTARRPPRGGYFFPIVTVAVPVGETQPAEEISVTESVAEPFVPTENVIWLVP